MKAFNVVVGIVVLAVVAVLGYVIWYEVNDPGHGTITGKRHNSMYVTCSGKPIICTTHPECYRIYYTDGHHDGDACVTPLEYDRYRVGEQFPSDGPR